eukprot:jgi/Botrbrau1/11881/Bobra.126_2s0015.1
MEEIQILEICNKTILYSFYCLTWEGEIFLNFWNVFYRLTFLSAHIKSESGLHHGPEDIPKCPTNMTLKNHRFMHAYTRDLLLEGAATSVATRNPNQTSSYRYGTEMITLTTS